MAVSSPTFRDRARSGCWVILGLMLGITSLHAGERPVYRCAMESWPARDYQAVIFHRGSLGMDEQNLVTALKESPMRWGANLAASTVDIAEPMDESTSALWTVQTNAEPPWMVVLTAARDEASEVLWASRFDLPAVKTVLDSPARKKVIEALVRGDSAVWVLLECGDAMRDEAAVDTLAATLKQLETRLQSSNSTTAAVAKIVAPMRLAFSLVRVTRNDPAEEFFVNLLSQGERFHRGKPAAFPVFGRGRSLGALAGKHLDDEFILDACSFITGPCTNGVKEVKPGKDILLCVQWDSILEEAARSPAPAVQTNTTLLPLAGKAAVTNASPSIDEAVARPPGENLSRAALVMIGVVAVAALVLWRLRRR